MTQWCRKLLRTFGLANLLCGSVILLWVGGVVRFIHPEWTATQVVLNQLPLFVVGVLLVVSGIVLYGRDA